MKKNFLIVLFLISTSIFADQQDTKKTIYSAIQEINLETLAWDEREWPNESYYNYLKRVMSYQKNMEPLEKRKKIFNLLSKFEPENSNSSVLADFTTLKDLELFAGQEKKESYLVSHIDRTQTEFGKLVLMRHIADPLTGSQEDIETLQERQSIIKNLVSDTNRLKRCAELLKEIGEGENYLLSFWGWDALKQAAERHYYKFPMLQSFTNTINNNEYCLLANSLMNHQVRISMFCTSIVASVLLPIYGVTFLTEKFNLSPGLTQTAESLRGAGGRGMAIISSFFNHPGIKSWATITAGLYCGLSIKGEAEWVRDNFFIYQCLQKKLIKIAELFKAIKELAKEINDDPILKKIPHCKEIIKFGLFTELHSDDLYQLVKTLESSTFNGSPSIISHTGRILVAYKLMHDIKREFEPICVALGYIDTYISMARLVKEFEEKPVHYSFVDFIENPTPIIELTDFWNPFLNPDTDNIVTNCVKVGYDERPNLIITGPNAAGKSTIIKGVALNLILAQTFGIVAASHACLTPFDVIITYMNIKDDISSGNSKFKNQVIRAHKIIEVVIDDVTKKCFVIIDEMFNGTTNKEGYAAAYSVAKYLSNCTNLSCWIATHYKLLTMLQDETATVINYQVPVEIEQDGSVINHFKLKKGVSVQHVAINLLKQDGFDSEILDTAFKIINAQA